MDLSWQMVVDGTRSPEMFQKEFYGEFSRLNMKLIRAEQAKEIISIVKPEIISQVEVTSEESSVTISNLGLRAPGLIWGYITELYDQEKRDIMENAKEPSGIQIKYRMNNLNERIIGSRFYIGQQ